MRKQKKSIKRQFILVIGGMVAVMAVIAGSSIYLKAGKEIKKAKVEAIENQVEYIKHRMETLSEEAVYVAEVLADRPELRAEKLSELEEKELYDVFSHIQELYPKVVNLIFLNDEAMYIYPDSSANDDYVPIEREWYQNLRSSPVEDEWDTVYQDTITGKWIAAYLKKVYHNGQYIGMVEIDISVEEMIEVLQQAEFKDEAEVQFINYEGMIQIHEDESCIESILEDELKAFALRKENDSDIIKLDGNKYFTEAELLNTSLPWKIVTKIPIKQLYKEANQLFSYIIILCSILIIISILAVIYLVKHMTDRMDLLKDHMTLLGEGDLTIDAVCDREDEIGEMENSFNDMVKKMRSLMSISQITCHTILDSSESAQEASKQYHMSKDAVAKAIYDIEQGALEQANEASEVTVKFNDLSKSMENIAANITHLHHVFSDTQQTNEMGVKVIEELLKTAEETYESMKQVQVVMQAVDKNSHQIDGIVSTITEIAQQTNLLALNASIEAARAGESGKGFAVVAEEVRKLAENASQSAGEIRELIDEVKVNTQSAVFLMQSTNIKSQDQTKVVKETRVVFERLKGDIDKLAGDVKEIDDLNSHMIESKSEIEEIIHNMSTKAEANSLAASDMSSKTQEQTSIVEEMYEMLNNLGDQTKKLQSEMTQFKTE